jgi:hypothetical protein
LLQSRQIACKAGHPLKTLKRFGKLVASQS